MRWLQPNLESLLSTDGTCFVCECVVVGKPAVHGNRMRTVEPGEERQLLQVVVKSVDRARDRGNIRTGQRITDLQVALASAHLADVPPQRRRIVAKRVVKVLHTPHGAGSLGRSVTIRPRWPTT